MIMWNGLLACAIEHCYRPANLVSGMPGFVEHAASQHVKYCLVHSLNLETVAVSNYSFNVCVSTICGWVGGGVGGGWVVVVRACVRVHRSTLSLSHIGNCAHRYRR